MVKAFENPDQPNHCIVHIFEKYMSKRPSMDSKYSFDLYLHPLACITSPNVWYSCQAIGVQTLTKVMVKLAHAAGLPGKHSNHSLHVTVAIRLYDQNVDEHRISKITGHCSFAVRNYQCVSIEKKKGISDVLYGKHPKKSTTHIIASLHAATFDMGTLSQVTGKTEISAKTEDPTKIVVNVPDIKVNAPVLKFPEKPIVVQPVVNLNARDIPQDEKGQLIMPEIMVELVINIK